jgi:formylglycine-generating enzyme required for sulfatase activity
MLILTSCKESKPTEPDPDSIKMDWVFVKGGTFMMGDTSGVSWDKKQSGHPVTLSSFCIGKFEVTNAQYAEFLNAYKSDTVKSGEYAGEIMVYVHFWGVWKTDSVWAPYPGYANHPVLDVTWYGANEFCLNNGWRLPTDAEWEYAAKGGNLSRGYKYSGSDNIDEVAWYSPIRENYPGTYSHPVGGKKGNELGIYDMSGNIWEWCWDWYGPLGSNAEVNPRGPSSGYNHVYRGGSWLSIAGNCRTTTRVGGGIDYHGVSHNGIRCVK